MKIYLKITCLIITIFFATPAYAQVKIDDVSHLNETVVNSVRKPTDEHDIQKAVQDALANEKKISIAGRRHSQGGHVMADDAIVLDMTGFNKIIGLNSNKKILTVQSGATWADVQNFLNDKNLAVKIQQSSNIFTVGGSLSANIHGRDPRFGPIIEAVDSFRLVKPDGTVVEVSRTHNPDLFSLAIGGYGLFGVITEIKLYVIENSVLQKFTKIIPCKDYIQNLSEVILPDKTIELHHARPSIANQNLMEECLVIYYYRIADKPAKLQPLEKEKLIATSKWLMGLSRQSEKGKAVRWYIQEAILDAPGKGEIITRNNAMRPPIEFLDYKSEKDTDVLQEYFVPMDQALAFMDDLKNIIKSENINVLSITLRFVKADRASFLTYVPEDSLAIVLYINYGRDEASIEKSKKWTRKLIDASTARDGKYYLTYSNYATESQIKKAYPSIEDFWNKKKIYDPKEIFTNKFYEHYAVN